MSMGEAVRSVLTQYATFSGRARRSEYWYFCLAYLIAQIVTTILDVVLGTTVGGSGVITGLLNLALLLPSLAVAVRRMHDTGRTGWWVLISIIPLVGWIVFIVFACQDSDGDNQYGPNPKARGVAYPYAG